MKVLYVAGAMRSGSTLLVRTLGELEGVFPAGEVFHFFGRAAAADELCSCGTPASDCPIWGEVIRQVGPPDGFGDARDVDDLRRSVSYGRHIFTPLLGSARLPEPRRLSSYRALLGRLYRAIGRVTGARLLVDASKVPSYGWLLSDLPGVDMSVLHLVRDSRGVVHSWSKDRERPGAAEREARMNQFNAASGALVWSVSQMGAEILQARVGRRTRVRYRDFVHSPEAVVRKALRLVGEEELLGTAAEPGYMEALRRGEVSLSPQHTLAGNPMRMQSGPIRLREDDAWRREMDRARQGAVTALTWPLLRRYGIRAAA